MLPWTEDKQRAGASREQTALGTRVRRRSEGGGVVVVSMKARCVAKSVGWSCIHPLRYLTHGLRPAPHSLPKPRTLIWTPLSLCTCTEMPSKPR